MPDRQEDRTATEAALELVAEHGFDGMLEAFRTLLNEAMRIERSEVLGAAPYERTDERRGYANGYKPKTLRTRLGEVTVRVPKARGAEFYPKSLERGVRSERALKLAVAEMYVQGVSTRKVTEVVRELCGLEVTSSQVSRAAALLDEELERWRKRPLGSVPYLILDARYEKVRVAGGVADCAVLIALGVGEDGRRSVLGVSVSLSEAEAHWRAFLASLLDRGLRGVRLVASDDHAGLRAARRALLGGVPWQRCQFHLQRNAQAYVPKVSMRAEVASAIREVFAAPERAEAERRLKQAAAKYAAVAPKLSAWMEEAAPEGFAVYALPPHHRRRLRTTNALERLNREIKRRTRVATLFPNEASLLRLVSAVLSETSEEWETGRVYLNTETDMTAD
ncbi:MAG: IS256 family transposase [Candidatus Methylomirabilis sp.]|nr:IS256 family transposase [Deltaproteobacteria bacterium]